MNRETLQARAHDGLSYLEADERRTIAGPGLSLSFVRDGDRWTHALAVEGEAGNLVELFRTAESDADSGDPTRVISPTYQDLHEHPVSGGIRLLLTGQATPHHFSAVVTARLSAEGLAVEFDVADRCRGPLAALAATYLVPLGSSDLSEGTPGRIAWQLGSSRLELTAPTPVALALAEAGRRACRVQASAPLDPAVQTHRFLYCWRWNAPGSSPGSRPGDARL